MKTFNKVFIIVIFTIFAVGTFFYFEISKKISKFDLEKAIEKKNIIPIAVIGSGPSGLSAALYGARSAIKTVVFEGEKPGGQLTETTYVENWPGTKKLLGSELIAQNRKQAEKFGALMVNDSIEAVDFSTWPYKLKTEEGHKINALSVIISTGSYPRLLNVPGEKEYWGYGVTTCAVCDAPFYKNKKVVVVGGGDSAVEEASLLSSYADKVYVLVRSDKMRAAPPMQARLKKLDNVEILYNTSITKILGNSEIVTSIEIKNNKDNTISNMNIDGVFLAIGHEPNSEIFKDFIKLDNLGYVLLSNRSQKTNIPGIFAAGDISDRHYRQAGTAAGDGIKAALDAVGFLQNIGFNDSFASLIEENYYDPDFDADVELLQLNTIDDFNQASKKSEYLVIEVGAEYCSSCKVLLKNVKSIAAKFEEKVTFAQIDVNKSKELKEKFNLKSIPVLLIIKDGKILRRFDGKVVSKHELYLLINDLMNQE